jgi:nitrogen regulatory protein P-II 1
VELLIAVINDVDLMDEVLAGFLEIGITGATVLDSEGMGRVLSHDIPIFAGLQTLISRSRPQNQTLFSVIDDPDKVDRAIALLQDVCGRFEDPATGIAITLPVNRVVGLAPELGDSGG